MMFDRGEIPILGASFAVAIVFLFLRRFNAKRDEKRYPPSLPVLPLLWTILRGGMAVLPKHFMRVEDKMGPIFSFKVGRRLVVVLNGYQPIFDALVRRSEAFAHRDSVWVEEKILNLKEKGFIFAPYNDAYKKYHKLSLPILREFGLGVARVSETRILQEVESLNEKILKLNGRAFDPKWPITFATSNVVLSILFGGNFLQSLPKDLSTIVECSLGYFENMDVTLNMAPFLRFLPSYWRKVECMIKLNRSLLNSIEAGISFIKSNDSETTFIGRFMETVGTDYSHEDLLYIVRDLCFGGTDTVSGTMNWTLVELANHPEVLNRLQREIDEVVPGNRFPSLDEKQRMPYTEAVLLEILRLHAVAVFFIRHTNLNEIKVLGYDIPQGCVVILNAYSAHMDQTFWKDPETFRPERFLDMDNKIINNERVITFGLGKRSCLGEILGRQILFLFLASLVQRFDIRPPEGQKSINVTAVVSATTTPSRFEVRLSPRVKTI